MKLFIRISRKAPACETVPPLDSGCPGYVRSGRDTRRVLFSKSLLSFFFGLFVCFSVSYILNVEVFKT